MSYFLVIVMNDIEPELWGPYDSEESRNAAARKFRTENGYDHGIFWLDIEDDCPPSIGAYSNQFFEEKS